MTFCHFGHAADTITGGIEPPIEPGPRLIRQVDTEISKRLTVIQKSALEAELPSAPTVDGTGDQRSFKAVEALKKMKPVEITIDDKLREAGNEITHELKGERGEMIDSLDLSKYVCCFGQQHQSLV